MVNTEMADHPAEVLVLGAGPGGYTAAFRAADLGKQVVLVDREPTLGGVCLNVGCIPSKALLHAAKVIAEAREMGGNGISFGPPDLDLDRLRAWKDSVIARLTGEASWMKLSSSARRFSWRRRARSRIIPGVSGMASRAARRAASDASGAGADGSVPPACAQAGAGASRQARTRAVRRATLGSCAGDYRSSATSWSTARPSGCSPMSVRITSAVIISRLVLSNCTFWQVCTAGNCTS